MDRGDLFDPPSMFEENLPSRNLSIQNLYTKKNSARTKSDLNVRAQNYATTLKRSSKQWYLEWGHDRSHNAVPVRHAQDGLRKVRGELLLTLYYIV
jgi:hypothetical protein